MILYVLRYFPAYSETFVAGEIAAVRALGRRVAVLSLGRRREPVNLPTPPGTWEALRGVGRVRGIAAWLRHRDHPRVRWLAARQGWRRALVACHTAARATDVTHVHAHFAGEAAEVASAVAALLGCPWSVTVHASDLFKPRPGLGPLLADASAVVTVAAHHQQWLSREYDAAAALVRCGVAPTFLAVRPAPPARPLAVVCVARAVPKKGLDRLISAVSGDSRFALRLVATEPPERIPEILAESHVFALAARVADDGDRDGVPVALLEAMAAGLPVIATAVSGIPEVVDDEVGWLIPADDPAALLSALEAALDPTERRKRGDAGRARVVREGWTLEGQARGLLAAIGA